MGFADEVEASASATGSNVAHVTRLLNALPAKDRKEIVAFLDDLPPGAQKVAVARALTKRAAKAGLDVKVTAQQVTTFINGSRHGLVS